MRFGKTIPILRMFDEAKAREFYVNEMPWGHERSPSRARSATS
jgi:hypothetical protein